MHQPWSMAIAETHHRIVKHIVFKSKRNVFIQMALQAPKKQHIVNSCINSKKRLDNSFEHYNALLFFFLVGVYHLLWVFAGFDENRSALGNV